MKVCDVSLKMKIIFVISSTSFLFSSINCQKQGYEYGPPPVETQLRPRPGPEPVQIESFTASKPQPSGGGHSHADADDPLAWLRICARFTWCRLPNTQHC